MTKIAENWTVVSPAYGRDYKTQKDAKAAFLSGVDFRMESIQYGGAYCSIRDFESGVKVNVRFRKLMGIAVVQVP